MSSVVRMTPSPRNPQIALLPSETRSGVDTHVQVAGWSVSIKWRLSGSSDGETLFLLLLRLREIWTCHFYWSQIGCDSPLEHLTLSLIPSGRPGLNYEGAGTRPKYCSGLEDGLKALLFTLSWDYRLCRGGGGGGGGDGDKQDEKWRASRGLCFPKRTASLLLIRLCYCVHLLVCEGEEEGAAPSSRVVARLLAPVALQVGGLLHVGEVCVEQPVARVLSEVLGEVGSIRVASLAPRWR
ncbi:hypothetical protein Fcan01_21107 [Folsomia candida]|uniref:Uncharacterized protein n=1 Tax=Folsomia candida TaxID=158441 RepID=A0A226DGZ0_FOLCA|nr:hypothetical protein Fcan01_21107 [Folsomia candida]